MLLAKDICQLLMGHGLLISALRSTEAEGAVRCRRRTTPWQSAEYETSDTGPARMGTVGPCLTGSSALVSVSSLEHLTAEVHVGIGWHMPMARTIGQSW